MTKLGTSKDKCGTTTCINCESNSEITLSQINQCNCKQHDWRLPNKLIKNWVFADLEKSN